MLSQVPARVDGVRAARSLGPLRRDAMMQQTPRRTFVLALPGEHVRGRQIIFVVAPNQIIDGRPVQHLHHAAALVDGAQEVGHQKVARQHADRDGFRAVQLFKFFALLDDQRLQVREIVQSVHIRDMNDS